jgi:predicted GTPase
MTRTRMVCAVVRMLTAPQHITAAVYCYHYRHSKEDDDGLGRTVQLAIVGRPNVGKSSMLNAILDEDRYCNR